MRLLLIGLLSLITVTTSAQGWVPAGARSMSLANASTTIDDVWAYHNNPGALGAVEEFTAGISYENRFLLKELQSQGIAVAIPLKVGVISIGGHLYGYNRFRSYKAGLGYSMRLAKKIYAGVQLNYQGITLSDGYGSRGNLTAEAGIYAKITDKWKLGFSVFNLNRAKLSDYEDDRFSTIMRLGSSYTFSKKFTVLLEAEKALEHRFRFKAALEYQVIDKLYIRGGVATAPLEFSFGLGYHMKKIHIGFGTAYHQYLGWSPHFSLVFVAKK
ncbi:MAG: hypothetical protein QNK23_06350 [Crocinitomicaceae bacterium]|nr:hypothetical protein [Crocinitomicaceae bacterium]